MAISNWDVSIVDAPLQFPGEFLDSASGAAIDFWGMVREIEDGRAIEGINYEVHRVMAQHQMSLLAEKATVDFFLTGLVLQHRVGFVPAGEASLFLRTASRHRAAAFAASQWLIAELKERVPIWKRPIFKAAEAARSEQQLEETASR